MTESFNQSLYDASVRALTDNGVPEDLAEKASQVVASDDPTKPDLGRTETDQQTINETMNYLRER